MGTDMDTLPKLYPNVDDLLAIPPADLAPVLLEFARIAEKNQNSMFDPSYVISSLLAINFCTATRRATRHWTSRRLRIIRPRFGFSSTGRDSSCLVPA
jgi:hypothetical protein